MSVLFTWGRNQYLLWAALFLGTAWLSAGCNPATLNFLVAPFVDNRIPAKCKLACKDKEVAVAVVANFGYFETRPELMSFDSELSERLIQKIRKRCADNKEKIKFVPLARVKSVLSQDTGDSLSRQEIGKKLKADYVINLEITEVKLFEKGSFNQLFRGNTEINVTVIDVDKPRGEGTMLQEIYRCEYPGSKGPIDVSGSSIPQFRTMFLDKIARDLSRFFTAYPPDEHIDMRD